MVEEVEKTAEIARSLIEKENATDPEIRKIMKIVHKFIQTKRVICYGGTAINNILQKKDQFYDFTVDIPDYDFFSETPTEHAKQLADILVSHKIENIQVKPGVHLGTFKVFANYTGVADISFIDKPIFHKLWKESIVKDEIHYTPPNFLRMSVYLELSRPRGDVSRWKKVYSRLMKLNAEYPIECSEKDVEFHKEKVPENLKDEIEKKLKDNSILLGFNAFNELGGQKQWSIPIDLLALKEDVKDVVSTLEDSFGKSGKVKVFEYPEYAELLPPHYDIVDHNDKLIVRVFETNACHSYHETKSGMKLASIPTLLNFLFAMLYSDKHFTETTTHQRLICACQTLVDMANNSKKRRFKLLTPITCMGHQKDLKDMRKEREELYSELKKHRQSQEFLKYFFSYTPKSKHKFSGGNLSRMFPKHKDVDYSKLQITEEGRFSITKPYQGEHMMRVMKHVIKNLKERTIADLTANVGGDTIRFGLHFKHVDSYELKDDNFSVLKNNVEVYNLQNVDLHLGDSTKLFNKHVDVVYLDPPWGGPDYKEKTDLDLFLGDLRVDLFIKEILEKYKPSFVFMKVPNNYNFKRFEGLEHSVYDIEKFKLISIKRKE